jgi:hypothetical protein
MASILPAPSHLVNMLTASSSVFQRRPRRHHSHAPRVHHADHLGLYLVLWVVMLVMVIWKVLALQMGVDTGVLGPGPLSLFTRRLGK